MSYTRLLSCLAGRGFACPRFIGRGFTSLNLAGLCAALALAAPGCNSEAPAGPGGPAASSAVRSEEELLIVELGSAERFSPEIYRAPKNAEALVRLAQDSEDARVQRAALHAMARAFHPTSPERAKPSGLYEQAVLKHLGADAPALGYALFAARLLLQGPTRHPELEKRLLTLSVDCQSGPCRHAVLETLGSLDSSRIDEEVLAAVLALSASAEPYVISRALDQLAVWSRHLQEPGPALQRVTELLAHSDPGVRGRAAIAAASLGAPPDLLAPSLKDNERFVVASTCSALARVGARSLVPKLIALSGDPTPAGYAQPGFVSLLGSPSAESHKASPSGSLGEAAALAVSILARGEVKLEPVPKQAPEAPLTRNKAKLQAWWTQNASQVAKADAALRD